jgi:hypothetical protein
MSVTIPTLTPAYARDYRSKTAVVEAFLAGKDFVYNDVTSPYDGKYCSIRDFKPGQQLHIRYYKLTRSTYFTVPTP